MIYENIPSGNQLNISQILFVHICDYGEECNSAQAIRTGSFWELLYAEKGLVGITAPSLAHTLSKSELLFRHPSETLQLHVQSPVPAKFISIGFTCTTADTSLGTASSAPSPEAPCPASESSVPIHAMEFFRGKILPIGSPERTLLRLIVTEAASCQSAVPFASGQVAMLYLQLLLILLIRNGNADITLTPVPRSRQLADEDSLFREILAYMEDHIAEHLTIDQICRDNLVGLALLKKLFNDNTGCGIIDYFSLMKINTAKQLIREGTLNFSQIAEQLGYNSIHYFSRQFKTIAGITPSEYAANLLGRKPL